MEIQLSRRLFSAAVSLLLLTAHPSRAASQPSLAPMLERVIPGVVSISVQGQTQDEEDTILTDPFFRKFFGVPDGSAPQQHSFQAAGSGVIVDAAKGYILTNNHVVENADRITVSVSGEKALPAELVGTDPDTDLAVIKVKAPHLTGVPLGSSDKLKVGDYVVAIGNPFGLSQTATLGIVSALGRAGLGIEGYESFIQTDASINPGNSGGALVNLDGELVGINSAIMGPSGGNVGIGFAIPVDMAKQVMGELIAHGKVRRGQLGVVLQDLTPLLAKALDINSDSGALVSQVLNNSPAEIAGIKLGDVIISIEGADVHSVSELKNKIGSLDANATVRLVIIRGTQRLKINASLTAVETPISKIGDRTLLIKRGLLAGVEIGDVADGGQVHTGTNAVQVIAIDDTSKAAEAGLEAGDIIISVDQKPVASLQDVLRLSAGHRTPMLLLVSRNGQSLFLGVDGP